MHKIYSMPMFAYELQTYLLDRLEVRYIYNTPDFVISNSDQHIYRIMFNAAILYEVSITNVESRNYLSISIANRKETEEVLIEELNILTLINTLNDLCNRLEIRIFK